MAIGDAEIAAGGVRYSVVPAQRVPRTRHGVRPQPIDWRAMAKQIEIAKRIDRSGKRPASRPASVGTYTRKYSGNRRVGQR